MTDYLLDLQGICMNFPQPGGNELAVLRDVSLTLHPGESVAIMGANGSGKTTLLRIILGDLRPTQGWVVLMDRVHTTTPAYQRAQLIGSVHQESYKSLASELTVEEVLSIAARRNKELKLRFPEFDALRTLFDELSNEVAEFILERRKIVTRELSGGQRQMLAIICALLGDPKLLLLDEHLASLDHAFTNVANQLLRQYIEKGGASISVTHDRAWANSHANKIGKIRNGKLSFAGME